MLTNPKQHGHQVDGQTPRLETVQNAPFDQLIKSFEGVENKV